MMSEITERMDLVASSSLDALGGRERLDAMEAVMELALDSPESLTVFGMCFKSIVASSTEHLPYHFNIFLKHL